MNPFTTAFKAFRFKPRLLAHRKSYRRKDFVNDLAAGVTVAMVALPLAMAFGIASGVRPVGPPGYFGLQSNFRHCREGGHDENTEGGKSIDSSVKLPSDPGTASGNISLRAAISTRSRCYAPFGSAIMIQSLRITTPRES